MDITDILLIAVLIVFIISIFYKNKNDPTHDQSLGKVDERLGKVEDKLNSVGSSVNEKLISFNKDVTKEVAMAMSQFNERLGSFDKTLGFLKEGQDNFNRILSGVKHFGGTSEWSLKAIVAETLPNSFYVENAKLNPETRDFVELAIKLPTNILLPIDSHWSKERYKDVVDAFYEKDQEKLKKARKLLADAYRKKAEEVKEKYINPPISTPFALVYVPVSGLYRELEDYKDPKTKEDLFIELQKKFQVTIVGPNTLFQVIQAFNIGFATLRVQKFALQIYDDLKHLHKRFSVHFSNITNVSRKLEEAMQEVNKFGTDARVISRVLENIKDPGQVEKVAGQENNKEIEDHSKRLKN